MVVMSRKAKRQIKRNTADINSIQGNGRRVFRRRRGKARLVADSSEVIRASCIEDAGSDATINVKLFNLDGTVGDTESVFCNISNGSALNEASPLLEIGDVIYVKLINIDNSGTPVPRFECVSNFMTFEECTCG